MYAVKLLFSGHNETYRYSEVSLSLGLLMDFCQSLPLDYVTYDVSAFCIQHKFYCFLHNVWAWSQAGKLIPRGPGAGECLSEPRERLPTPDLVKKLRGMTRPEPGQQRVFHSFAGDAPVAKEIRHGIGTKDSLAVSCCLR